ncbi:MAG: hypothetical protein R3234_01130 [Thermoanaerobaculia bacterium]|nr:hypothetical protein [Thermoanaerobaculia bacterium]
MIRRLLIPLAVGVLGAAYGYWIRDYPVSFALVLGAAVGTLAWAARRTTERLRETSGRR